MGIGPGDEVVTVPMSFAATVEAICFAGATPVFVDIDERTYTMNPAEIEKAITARTKAIIPVHLFGQAADMDPILEIARSHRLRVIEDAAQAHGAKYSGRMVGSIGDAGCFSFHPCKNLGGFGERGAVVTGDDELAGKIRMLRNHGQSRKNQHSLIGWNCRMDGIQAAVLSIKLRHLDGENRKRREHALSYDRELANFPGVLPPQVADGGQHVFHVYAVRTRNRRDLMRTLEGNGVGCGVHYPVPIHLQTAYLTLGYKRGYFPVAEQCADEFVSLPIYPEMTSRQVVVVADVVREALDGCLAL